jgi:hypothetical protein
MILFSNEESPTINLSPLFKIQSFASAIGGDALC